MNVPERGDAGAEVPEAQGLGGERGKAACEQCAGREGARRPAGGAPLAWMASTGGTQERPTRGQESAPSAYSCENGKGNRDQGQPRHFCW